MKTLECSRKLSVSKKENPRHRRPGIFLRTMEIGALGLIYVLFSFAIGMDFGTVTGQIILSCVLSFAVVGFAVYYCLHYILAREMLNFDLRILRALEKRGLIEIGGFSNTADALE